MDSDYDIECYNNCNYFHTKDRAEEVLQKIKYLLKLERFHDMFCPDYKPDWEDCNPKYYVFYYRTGHKYLWESVLVKKHECVTYFPTKEIAERVCDILDKEKEETE